MSETLLKMERDHLDKFANAINASPTALERPVCRGWVGDYQITGKHGPVLADGSGYLLYITGSGPAAPLPQRGGDRAQAQPGRA
jgi:hypothetical protein